MRYIGLDFGMKRIGISLSDLAGSFAFPKDIFENDARSVERIAALAREEHVTELVLGDTLAANGEHNPLSAFADEFARKLEGAGFVVHRTREAWSSAEAMRYAPPGKRHDDSAAAAIILQRFLDARGA
ncbi:MAG: hypothetical protein RLZZ342_553 [Candidatus Parcubacteria bacterium]|jgi:putative Holliday junction resolvase